jgi:hypothetical protein
MGESKQDIGRHQLRIRRSASITASYRHMADKVLAGVVRKGQIIRRI